ncbi:inovirus-type Gp2 protein [Burkholderia sp. 22PA0106]|uniref:YagK/YfjJ domain-containing protein n=1 Tax=Burkholderia sp. 22PA0106 TaxID=3237371 RepID=UPI0039C02946
MEESAVKDDGAQCTIDTDREHGCVMPHVTDSGKRVVSEDELTHVNGIVENLDRNMGAVYGLDGKGYRVGVSVKLLSAQIEFMHCVIDTDALPYEIKRNADGSVCIVKNKMAKYVELLPEFERLVLDGLALSPDLALFHRVYAKHAISWHLVTSKRLTTQYAERCNALVLTLRAEGERIGIKRLLRNWRRNADENAKRLTRYLNALHDRHARLMVIRLDLMYRQTACFDLEQAMRWNEVLMARNYRERDAVSRGKPFDDEGDDLPRVDIFTVTEDWRHFKDNMRGKPSLFRHMIGYVCSIEFSSTGGHHLHVALIFDGSQVKQHEWLGDSIGDYWVETTGGRGYYHNCNRGSYKYLGVGLIDHHDAVKRGHLMRALMYLAKKDQFVRVKASPKSKTFMTGHFPKALSGRTGRPRTKGLVALPDEAPDGGDNLEVEAA